MNPKHLAVALATAVAVTPANAQRNTNISEWRRDLKTIADQLPATHPNAFLRLKRSSWDSAVASIDSRLPSMTRNQAMVALSQLVAMVNDGHTAINPLFDPAMDIHYYPVRFELFEDGLFIRSAAPQYASIAGARVVRIGKVTAEQAVTAMGTTFGHENDWWVRAWAPIRLNLSEILDGLGIVDDARHLSLVIEKNGKRETVTLQPAARITPAGHNPLGGFDMQGWADMRSSLNPPLWLQHPERPYWAEFQKSDSTLFVSYRAVITMDDMPNNVFWQRVFAMADSLPVKRLVLDLRENGGGNNFFNRQVVRGIVARPRLDKANSFFVIIGDRTFSAAMNLVQDLEQWTNATLVGEPTGNASLFFGDHTQIRLPVSGITLNVSTMPWYPSNPRDARAFIPPRLYTPLTSTDYRSNVDPAMQAIMRFGSIPPLADRVTSAISAGDSGAAFKLVTDAAHDPVNRFRSPEADINALGYRLADDDAAKALAVFRINTQAFPASPNVWDSYAEALLKAGKRDEAIVSYRKAVSLDPGYASSLDALRRLGAR